MTIVSQGTLELGKSFGEIMGDGTYPTATLAMFMPMRLRGFEVVADEHRKHVSDVKDDYFTEEITLTIDGKQVVKYAPVILKPRRAEEGACASDVFSPVDLIIQPDEQILIWTDIRAYMQLQEVLIANVRSSQGKPRVQLANTQGWIDSTYYKNPSNDGNIGIYLRNEGVNNYVIKKGDRIAQLMFIPYLIPDNDDPMHNQRMGGFGSSGK